MREDVKIKKSIAPSRAKEIMGNNFFSLFDWKKYFKNIQIADYRKDDFPWSEEILNERCPWNFNKRVKDTHVAFFGIPEINGNATTVAEWFKLHLDLNGKPDFLDLFKLHDDRKGRVSIEPRWYLILKDCIPNSTSKKRAKQLDAIPWYYELPTMIMEVTKILVFLKKGVNCNSSDAVVCKDRVFKDSYASVGFASCDASITNNGVTIKKHHDYIYLDSIKESSSWKDIGIGASRRPFI